MAPTKDLALFHGAALAIFMFLGAGTARSQSIEFYKHAIDDAFEAGYQVSVADVDGDGLDNVIALSTTPSRLVWYKNPDWACYTVSSTNERNIDIAPYDIDGDGDPDLALASEFSLGSSLHGGRVQWLECPDIPEQNQEWAAHDIDRVPTSHRLRWADLDGNGVKELLDLPIIGIGAHAPEYEVGVQFKAYEIPAEPKSGNWFAHMIDDSLHMAHGIAVVAWDDDAASEILTASFEGIHLYTLALDAKNANKTHLGSGKPGARPGQGSSEVDMGRLSSENRRFVATIEPWHGNEVVAYTPGATEGAPWSRRVIDDQLRDGHALKCADFDGDGNDEIVAGYRGADHNLYLYRYDGENHRWNRTTLDESGMGAAGLFLADLNRDGAVDLVAIGSATNNVVWYENLAGHTETEANAKGPR